MKILATGATGYLGRAVAACLHAGGHQVVALCRPGSASRLPPGVRPVDGDVLDSGSVRRALRGCDALVHMAAMVRMWSADPGEFDRVNVDSLTALLRAAEEAGIGRILTTSSVVALGPTDGTIGDETTERAVLRFSTDYERTKWRAERVVRESVTAGLPIVTVYPGVVYGPGAPTRGNLLRGLLQRYHEGRLRTRLGRSDRRICYAYIDDVARGHLLALDGGRPGSGYILGGENATQADLFAILQEISGHPPPRITVPYWAGEALGRCLQVVARVTGFEPPVTAGVVATFRHEWAYSSERAIRELGYRVTPLREGLARTLGASAGTARENGGGVRT